MTENQANVVIVLLAALCVANVINYFINAKTRLQINYQANIETNINKDNDALLMQLQVRF